MREYGAGRGDGVRQRFDDHRWPVVVAVAQPTLLQTKCPGSGWHSRHSPSCLSRWSCRHSGPELPSPFLCTHNFKPWGALLDLGQVSEGGVFPVVWLSGSGRPAWRPHGALLSGRGHPGTPEVGVVPVGEMGVLEVSPAGELSVLEVALSTPIGFSSELGATEVGSAAELSVLEAGPAFEPSALEFGHVSEPSILEVGESRREESHLPPLAEPCLNLSAYTAPIVQPPGLRPKRQCANSRGDRREASAINSPARFSRRRNRLYLRMAQRTR